MRFDRATVLRLSRAVMLLGLALELLVSVKYPWAQKAVVENMYAPRWHQESRSVSPIYSSSALLRRCQASMRFNTSSGAFETGQLSLWLSSRPMFAAVPAAGWATWQQLVMTAKNPWAVYWASKVVPETWHIMPRVMRENLQLFQAAVPVLLADNSSSSSSSSGGGGGGGFAGEDGEERHQDSGSAAAAAGSTQPQRQQYSSRFVAQCSSPVDHSTLKPVAVAYCTVSERANASKVAGAFQVQRTASRQQQQRRTHGAAVGTRQRQQQAVLGVGPLRESLQQLGAWLGGYAPLRGLVRGAGVLWHYAVPTGSLVALQPLLLQLRVLELEFEWEVLAVYGIALLVCLRNWVYLVCVGYKVARRLALLAFHGPLERFNGTLLTFIGMLLGLWQSLGYAVLDMAVDVALVKLQVHALGCSFTISSWLWFLSFDWGLFEMRCLVRLYKLASSAWADVKALVLNPQAIVAAAQQALDKPPTRQVATMGPWPGPLAIPDDIDDLPVSDVPRGFVCPITQAIMRQPALLLHDATVTPSTYDREAITQWLAEHSSDPKAPGSQLNMKSVKLVYNGDLARAIEDWAAAHAAPRRASQQGQLALLEQRLASIRMRAQATLFQQQQQHQQQQHQQHQHQHQHQQQAAAQQQQQQQQQAAFHFAAPEPHQQQQGAGPSTASPFMAAAAGAGAGAAEAGGGVGAAAGAGGAGNGAGGSTSSALHIMRTSSAALAQVASMDIPAVAAAGLATLADTTRRITTRAATRRLHQQQQQMLLQRQQQLGDNDDGSSSDSDAHTSGTAGEAAAWGLEEPAAGGAGRRHSTRVKYRVRRHAAAAE